MTSPLYILIIVGWISGYSNGPVTTTQEFLTIDSCNRARLTLAGQMTDWKVDDSRMHAFCVQK